MPAFQGVEIRLPIALEAFPSPQPHYPFWRRDRLVEAAPLSAPPAGAWAPADHQMEVGSSVGERSVQPLSLEYELKYSGPGLA